MNITSPLPLDTPPTVVHMGKALHGEVAVENYKNNFWSLHLYNYHAELIVAGKTHTITPGSISIVPPSVPIQYKMHGRSLHLYAHFRTKQSSLTQSMPILQDGGHLFAALYSQMELAVSYWSTQPARAQARLWDILWQLRTLQTENADTQAIPFVVDQTMHYIETNLSAPLRVSEIAKKMELSHNHLTRIFGKTTGKTIAYIRERRVKSAYHLLKNTTLPIKSIAAAVGIADPHAFNKIIRRELGHSPQKMRK